MECNEDKRNSFIYNIGLHYTPEQLVFLDENSFDRSTTFHGQAWAISGCQTHWKVFFVWGQRFVTRQLHNSFHSALCYRYSLLHAISKSGILSCKIVKGSFTTPLFKGFLQGLLNEIQPYPGPNSVIVMDNAKVHRSPQICGLIEAQYVSNNSNQSLH